MVNSFPQFSLSNHFIADQLKIARLETNTDWDHYNSQRHNPLQVKICDKTTSKCCDTYLYYYFAYGKHDWFDNIPVGNCTLGDGFQIFKNHTIEATIYNHMPIYTGNDWKWLGKSLDILTKTDANEARESDVLTCPISNWLNMYKSMKLTCEWKGNSNNTL